MVSLGLMRAAAAHSLGDGDKRKIADIIREYDRRYPTGENSIAASVVSAQHERAELELLGTVSSKTGVVNDSEAGRRLAVSMPTALYFMLRQQYPNLFSTEIKWFKRHFPMFVITK